MTALPHTPEAEAGLIAKLLVNPAEIPSLVGSVTAEDFWSEELGKAWAVMEANAGNAHRVDATTLKAAGIDLGDPLEFLSRATGAPASEYASIIRRDALRRRAVMALRNAEKRVRTADEAQVFDVVQEAVAGILAQHSGSNGLVSLGAAIQGYEPDAVRGLPWGLGPLDAAIQPVRPGELAILAARPSVGKTTIAEHIAMTWAAGSEIPVLFVSLEMSVSQLLARARARYGDLADLTHGYSLYYLDEPRATTATVRTQAARLRLRHGGVKAIVVDYLQLLKDPGEPEHVRVARISSECKALAREFSCPLLALSQLNRLSEAREDKRPRLADLRDSGAIEQDADLVLGLYRPTLASPDLDIGVLKNRHGPAGAWVEMYFDLKRVSVGEAA